MGSPDSPGKTSPFVLAALLGGLGLALVFLIRRGDELPGVLASDRKLQNEAELQRFNAELRQAFSRIEDWEGLCRHPHSILSALSLPQDKQVQLSSAAWEASRAHLPSSEKDASFRCRAVQFHPDDLRSKFCLHLAAGQEVTSGAFNMLELNLEWYQQGQRRPLSCSEALIKNADLELAIYYSYYRAIDRSREEWKFARFAGGMRLAPLRFKLEGRGG